VCLLREIPGLEQMESLRHQKAVRAATDMKPDMAIGTSMCCVTVLFFFASALALHFDLLLFLAVYGGQVFTKKKMKTQIKMRESIGWTADYSYVVDIKVNGEEFWWVNKADIGVSIVLYMYVIYTVRVSYVCMYIVFQNFNFSVWMAPTTTDTAGWAPSLIVSFWVHNKFRNLHIFLRLRRLSQTLWLSTEFTPEAAVSERR